MKYKEGDELICIYPSSLGTFKLGDIVTIDGITVSGWFIIKKDSSSIGCFTSEGKLEGFFKRRLNKTDKYDYAMGIV